MSRRQVKRWWEEALIGLLAGALALPSPTFGAPSNSPTFSDAERSAKEVESFDAELARLLADARYFGAPGLAAQPPSRAAVDALSQRLQGIRDNLQTRFLNVVDKTHQVDLAVGVSRILAVSQLYFALVLRLEELRAISGDATHPQHWDELYALEIPLRRTGDFVLLESLGELNKNFAKDEVKFFARLNPESSHLILAPLKKSLSDLDEARLAAARGPHPERDLVQYLAALMLARNQLTAQWRRGDAFSLQLPESLTQKFPSLAHLPEIFRETENLSDAQIVAAELNEHLPNWLTEINSQPELLLTSTELVNNLVKALGHTVQFNDQSIQPLITLERTNSTLVAQSMAYIALPSRFDRAGFAKMLTDVFTEAKATSLRAEFLKSATNSAGQAATADQSRQIEQLIESARQSLRGRIAPAVRGYAEYLANKINQARLDNKAKFVASLTKSAKEFAAIGSSEDVPVDPGALWAALTPDLKGLKLSQSAGDQLEQALKLPNYSAARDSYHNLLLTQLSYFSSQDQIAVPLTPDKVVEPKGAIEYLKKATFTDDVWSAAEAAVPSVKPLTKSIPAIAQQDTIEWIKAGELLGFFRFYKGEPKLRDLKLSKSAKARYFEELRLRALTDLPIFDLKLSLNDDARRVYEHLTLEGANLHDVVDRALLLVIQQIQTNYQVVANEQPTIWEKAKRMVGLESESDPTHRYLILLASSVPLGSQLGLHPAMAEAHLAGLERLTSGGWEAWSRRAWDRVVTVNGMVMTALMAWIVLKVLVKVPFLVSIMMKLESATRFGRFVELSSRTAGRLTYLESQIFAPAFGFNLVKLNYLLLGIFAASLADKGVSAFYSMPRDRDSLESFYTCSISGPCVIDARSMHRWKNEVSGLKYAWAMEMLFMAAFIFAGFGLTYLSMVTVPNWRLNHLMKSLDRKLRDIGFQNERISLHADDIDDMAEATIRSLDKNVHPAFDPFKPLPEALRGLERRPSDPPGSARPPTSMQLANLAKAGIAQRIRASAGEIKSLVRQEELYWRRWQLHLEPHLRLINGEGRFPNADEFMAFMKRIDEGRASGKLSVEQATALTDSLRKVRTFLWPHLIRAQTDKAYKHLLNHILQGSNAILRSGHPSAIRAFGGGYQTIQSLGATIPRNRQLVPLNNSKFDVVNEIVVQRGVRTSPYRLENEAWWNYLRQFVDASDFPMRGPSGPQLNGPPTQQLIGRTHRYLLEFFDRGSTL